MSIYIIKDKKSMEVAITGSHFIDFITSHFFLYIFFFLQDKIRHGRLTIWKQSTTSKMDVKIFRVNGQKMSSQQWPAEVILVLSQSYCKHLAGRNNNTYVELV